MIKTLLKTVSVLLLLALCAACVFFYSIFISLEHISISYHTITSSKIPADLNDVTVAFISDLEYNHYMDKERLSNMIKSINDARADVLIFGGDIFNQPQEYEPTDVTKQELIQLLQEIKAPLGKFAVLGEQDHVNEHTLDMVTDILYASDFELINNAAVDIRNQSNDSITLIGLDSLVNGTIDLERAFASVSSDTFNILIAHCPDTVSLDGLSLADIDLMFAGHSHASQLYLPFIGSLSTQDGAKQYNHGKHTIDDHLQLHITNGLGTYNIDMRLFSPPQMLVYRLHHEAADTGS